MRENLSNMVIFEEKLEGYETPSNGNNWKKKHYKQKNSKFTSPSARKFSACVEGTARRPVCLEPGGHHQVLEAGVKVMCFRSL